MVALKKYARIEASGLWRADAEAQRRDVVIVLGDATLTINTTNDQPLAHWSIAAIRRANPGKIPARYHPDGDPSEELELAENETEMIAAIETLRNAVEKTRPHPGRLRLAALAVSAAIVVYAALFWLPGALRDHTLSILPDVGRKEIGQSLLARLQRVSGPVCGTSANSSSLARLAERLSVPHLAIMRGGLDTALLLPGGSVLISRKLVEDFEEPDVAAGFVIAETVRGAETDPLRALLDHVGIRATFRLLTTGKLTPASLDSYAEALMTTSVTAPPDAALLPAFDHHGVRSTPYAYARDITGESVLGLIEGDPMRAKPISPLMSDADWLRLQSICGS